MPVENIANNSLLIFTQKEISFLFFALFLYVLLLARKTKKYNILWLKPWQMIAVKILLVFEFVHIILS